MDLNVIFLLVLVKALASRNVIIPKVLLIAVTVRPFQVIWTVVVSDAVLMVNFFLAFRRFSDERQSDKMMDPCATLVFGVWHTAMTRQQSSYILWQRNVGIVITSQMPSYTRDSSMRTGNITWKAGNRLPLFWFDTRNNRYLCRHVFAAFLSNSMTNAFKVFSASAAFDFNCAISFGSTSLTLKSICTSHVHKVH